MSFTQINMGIYRLNVIFYIENYFDHKNTKISKTDMLKTIRKQLNIFYSSLFIIGNFYIEQKCKNIIQIWLYGQNRQ